MAVKEAKGVFGLGKDRFATFQAIVLE